MKQFNYCADYIYEQHYIHSTQQKRGGLVRHQNKCTVSAHAHPNCRYARGNYVHTCMHVFVIQHRGNYYRKLLSHGHSYAHG